MYLSITLDKAGGCPVFIYSPAGGILIGDIAEEIPEFIFQITHQHNYWTKVRHH